MFKNALVYRITKPVDLNEASENLKKFRFTEIGRVEAQSIGFEAIDEDVELIHQVGDIGIGVLRIDSKSIPGSTMKELIKKRCEEIEAQQGYAPGKKQKREIKEQLIDECLPKVLPTTKRIRFMIYPDYLVIEATSSASADTLIGGLVKCLEDFPVELLNTEKSPAAAMTEWLVTDEAPEGFSIDQEVEMKSSAESKASVRWLKQSVDLEEAQAHYQQGKQCVKMAMTYHDRISFVLNEKGVIGKIKPLDVIKEKQNDSYEENAEELRDSDIALYGGELYRLINSLVAALGAEVQDE